MSRDYRLYLEDVREACEKVMRYIRGMTFAQFIQDEKTFDAVVRNLAIIGEAIKHVPTEVRSRYPGVEWRKIAGLRDVVTHDYFGVDEDILWDVVQHEVPTLLGQIVRILGEESPSEEPY